MKNNNDNIIELWKNFNYYANEISKKLGRTKNIVGEYAEYLVNLYLQGDLFPPSHSSADIKTADGKLYQVKARKINNNETIFRTQLSMIRSWKFDNLVVVIFNEIGTVLKASILPVDVVQKFGRYRKHVNGDIITTNQDFLEHPSAEEITKELQQLSNFSS